MVTIKTNVVNFQGRLWSRLKETKAACQKHTGNKQFVDPPVVSSWWEAVVIHFNINLGFFGPLIEIINALLNKLLGDEV